MEEEPDQYQKLDPEEVARIPGALTLGQVGPNDTVFRCRCGQIVAINLRAKTCCPVGRAELV
jgi:hypothetical protein